jgi:hypothetical protein
VAADSFARKVMTMGETVKIAEPNSGPGTWPGEGHQIVENQ